MKKLCFYGVLVGLSVGWLGNAWALSDRQPNLSYASNNILGETLISQTTAENFTARGTEPFWNITVNRNGIVFSSPEVSKRTYPYVAPLTAQGRPDDLLRVYQLNGQPNGTLIIRKADSCSDGMSDNVYPYQATLILGNQVMEGCAERN